MTVGLQAQIGQCMPLFNGSGFDFMNAITATARDENEPRRKWALEELGGGVLAMLKNKPIHQDQNPFDLFAPDESAEVDLLNAG